MFSLHLAHNNRHNRQCAPHIHSHSDDIHSTHITYTRRLSLCHDGRVRIHLLHLIVLVCSLGYVCVSVFKRVFVNLFNYKTSPFIIVWVYNRKYAWDVGMLLLFQFSLLHTLCLLLLPIDTMYSSVWRLSDWLTNKHLSPSLPLYLFVTFTFQNTKANIAISRIKSNLGETWKMVRFDVSNLANEHSRFDSNSPCTTVHAHRTHDS